MLDQLKHALAQTSDLSYDSLKQIVMENLPDWSEIEPYVEYGTPYGRALLFEGPGYEVMIGVWRKGDWCAAHDHGPASGLCYSYTGEVEHSRYMLEDGVLAHLERSMITPGMCMPLESGMIHSLRNHSSDVPYVGLHIYTPATSNVRVFDTKNGDIYHITDDHGAWVPEDPTKIRKVEKNAFTLQSRLELA